MSATDDSDSSQDDGDLPSYYGEVLGTQDSIFRDMDESENLNNCLSHSLSRHANNFVLDFNDDQVHISLDVSTESIGRLLQAGIPVTAFARWINVWKPFPNRPLLELFAKHYEFSPRLLALMSSEPNSDTHIKEALESEQESLRSCYRRRTSIKSTTRSADMRVRGFSLSPEAPVKPSNVDGNLYRLIDNLWHYTSVDWGRTYICIGYNSLYTVEGLLQSTNAPMSHCIRVWTWLILCDDNTIISINEDPLPFVQNEFDAIQQYVFRETRRNIVEVLRSLSLVQFDPQHTPNPMTRFHIRARLGDNPDETAHRANDAPSLLLYYIFENWHSSYIMVSRREGWYGTELARIREEMFAVPKLEHIDHLDHIGRELGVIKRHFNSLKRLISRVLEPQSPTRGSVENLGCSEDEDDRDGIDMQVAALGAPISSAARAKFKRLRELVDLYALREVEEYIKQKESLATMNFSLIAIKESLDVEKLTRITLLLTKATFLFLPVGVMTAYFSVSLADVDYTARQYWFGFGIVFLLSLIAMFIFGVFSGDVSTVVICKPMWIFTKKQIAWCRERRGRIDSNA